MAQNYKFSLQCLEKLLLFETFFYPESIISTFFFFQSTTTNVRFYHEQWNSKYFTSSFDACIKRFWSQWMWCKFWQKLHSTKRSYAWHHNGAKVFLMELSKRKKVILTWVEVRKHWNSQLVVCSWNGRRAASSGGGGHKECAVYHVREWRCISTCCKHPHCNCFT